MRWFNPFGRTGTKPAAPASQSRIGLLASPQLVRQRLTVCDGVPGRSAPCPIRTPDRRCAVCGCFVRKKARLVQEHCPHGRW